MGVHDELSRLVRDSGQGVLDDGDHFRAVLDDYLDEADATRGEVNLLVDAVRLGAFRRLQDQVAHGADVRRAIEGAAGELARDRGTTESASAAWALGVLAFAVGSLDEEGLAELRAAREPVADASPRPAPPPRSAPAAAPTTVKRPATIPDPAAPVGETSVPGRGRVVAAVVAAVVAVVGAVAGVAWWSAGDGEPNAGGPVRTTSSGPFEPLTVAGGTEVMKRVRTARTYRLTEDRISSSVVLTNTARRALTVLWAEVVPKELADHVSQVTFEPETRNVLEADPIVFWRLTLPAGGQRTVRWTTELAADVTPSADYLARATGWHREAVTRAEPQVTADLPAHVRPADVLLAPVVPESVDAEDVPAGSAPATANSPTSAPVTDPSTVPPRSTKAANRAPRLALRPTSSDEQDGVGYTVSASDPDGDSWSVVSVSGAPAGVGRSGARALGGTVSWRAASVTTHRSSIRSRSFAVTVTVEDSHGARASGSFTWTVRDTHLAMPAYVGKYGNSPDIGSLFVPNFVGCLDTSRPVDTIAKQSVPAGTPVRWGSSPRFTYVHHAGSYPAC